MNTQEIFVQAAKILYEDYLLYRSEKKNKDAKENTNNTKIKEKIEPKKKEHCC